MTQKLREILQSVLLNIKADGLCNLDESCGCGLDDLAPCGNCNLDECEPAKWIKPEDGNPMVLEEFPEGYYSPLKKQAALTKSLKKEIRRLKHESKVEQEFTNSYILHLHEAEARIKELEADNQNLVTMNKALMKNDWILRDNNRKYRKRSQKAELLNKSLKSKIGPDARPPCWQITEERKETLRRALEEYKIFPNDQAVLRAMLTEAE